MKEVSINPLGPTDYINTCLTFPGTMCNEEGSIQIARESSGYRVILGVYNGPA